MEHLLISPKVPQTAANGKNCYFMAVSMPRHWVLSTAEIEPGIEGFL